MNSARPQRNAPPVGLHRAEDGAILITWEDGETTRWTASELRKACPCATCREKRRADSEQASSSPSSKPLGLPVLRAEEARPLSVTGMSPVGTYAYNVAFSDGHNSGLFTFELLRKPSGS
ncbi:MAG: DUF971 domain-containing protein [Planctomycetota bacterium]